MQNYSSENIKHHSFLQNMLDRQFCENEWTYLYWKSSEKLDTQTDKGKIDKYIIMYSYLIPNELISKCLSTHIADIEITEGAALWSDNIFERFHNNNIELLVTELNFHDIRPFKTQYRLHEDIIYMFHLFEKSIDDFSKEYYDYNCGEAKLVAVVNQNFVKILHPYLVSFIKAKRMNLVCWGQSELNCDPQYQDSICDVYTGNEGRNVSPNEFTNYNHSCAFNVEYQNWFIGKRIIPYTAFDEFTSVLDPLYESFILGYNHQTGKNIEYACNDDNHKYNRVFFKKSVLEKYRSDSESKIEEYRVSSTYFSIKCDTCNDDYVWACLKDLRCMSYTEQQHWKAFNILPIDNGESDFYKDCIENQNWNPIQTLPDYIFRNIMYKLRNIWIKKYGWPIFKELEGVQANYPYQLFSLTTNDVHPLKDFITKFNLILSESINVASIKASGCEKPNNSGSINWLDCYFKSLPYESCDLIKALRNLNTLRSKLTDAHIDSLEFDSVTLKALAGFGVIADNLSWYTLDKILLSRNIFVYFNKAIVKFIQGQRRSSVAGLTED